MVFTGNHQGMASSAFVIKEGKHIDVYLKLILIQMDIVRRDWVRESFVMVALEHLFFVKTRFVAIPLWESIAFKKEKSA